jgi:hypothetical protein
LDAMSHPCHLHADFESKSELRASIGDEGIVLPSVLSFARTFGSVPDHCPAMWSHGSMCDVRLGFQHLRAVCEH